MKLAVFTVMLPDLTPEQAVAALASSGYDGIEWRVTQVPHERRDEPPSFWGNNLCTLAPSEDEARRARALAESVALAIPALGTYVPVDDLAGVDSALRFAQIAGSPSIRVHVGWLDGATYAQRFASVSDSLRQVASMARAAGIRALIEIHHRTLCPSASSAFRLVSQFDPEAVGVIYDPGNMVFEGFEDYQLGLELLGPYLAHVHIKNAAFDRPEGGGVWLPRWAPLEDGIVDFPKFFAALQSAGYDGWLSVEDFSAVLSSHEAVQHNVNFVRGMWSRIRGRQIQ